MARINTNVPAIVAQRTLRSTQRDLQVSLERLSSGLRINRGADDPAGLINSESLRAEIAGTEKAISNSQRAINIIATSEGALNEVASLLIDIQGLIVEIANDAAMSDDIFADLGLPAPDHHLGVGSGSHAEQTGGVMIAYEKVAMAERPDWLIVETSTDRPEDEGTQMLHHPLLADIPRLKLPQAWTVCGGPAYVDAARSLAEQLSRRPDGRGR